MNPWDISDSLLHWHPKHKGCYLLMDTDGHSHGHVVSLGPDASGPWVAHVLGCALPDKYDLSRRAIEAANIIIEREVGLWL